MLEWLAALGLGGAAAVCGLGWGRERRLRRAERADPAAAGPGAHGASHDPLIDALGAACDAAGLGLYRRDSAGRVCDGNASFAARAGVSLDEVRAGRGGAWLDGEPPDAPVSLGEWDDGRGGRVGVIGGGALPAPVETADPVLAHAPMGAARIRRDGTLVACNGTFAALFGLGPPPAHGADLLRAVDASSRGAVRAAVEAGATEDGRPLPVTPAGGEGALDVVAVRPGTAADETALYAWVRPAAHAVDTQVIQSQRMHAVGELAGTVAHDFNNLLTAMIGFCDLLLLKHRSGDQAFADLMQIKQNANRAANLVRQLLAFSRQQTLEPEVCSVTDILVDLKSLLERLVGETIALEMDHGSGLPAVRVDRGQFEQAVINLVVNARDAIAGGDGRIAIRTQTATLTRAHAGPGGEVPAGSYVRVDVADTGQGIAADRLPRIFEPFYTTKPQGEGTGLGLATAHGIVRQMDGHMQVVSTPGEGTVFSIYLPPHAAGEETAGRGERDREPVDLTGAERIMVVEDDEAVRTFAARALHKKGYTVVEARSGEDALARIADAGEGVDLLITDVVMPEGDGPELVGRLRAQMPTLPVIYISGYAEETFRARLRETPDARVLPKPFSLKDLAAAVRDALRQPV